MGKDEQTRTRGLDERLAERLARPLPFAGVAGSAGRLAGHLLAPPEGAPSVPLALDALLFRQEGALRLSVIVKATFLLSTPRMRPASEAEPLRPADVHYLNRPLGHVLVASDRVPSKPLVDVTLLGHACAPGGQPVTEMKARFVLLQGSRAIDKTVRVLGERRGTDAAPAPFVTMPITYDRTHGGVGTPANPIGCGADDDEAPSIVDPENPWRPAGFGPISAAWPLRNKRLGEMQRRVLEAKIVELPPGFDWGYFQSAPADQQLNELDPEAIVVLEGFHPGQPRMEVSLPDATACGAIYGLDEASPDAPTALHFRADTLHLDADRWIATITYRAAVDLRDEGDLERLLVAVGVDTDGRMIAIPRARPAPAAAPAPAAPRPVRVASAATSSDTATLDLMDQGELPPLTLPFGRGELLDPGAIEGLDRDTLLLPPEPGVLLAPPAEGLIGFHSPPTVPFPMAEERVEIRLPATPPAGPPARKASDFFHDVSRLPAPGEIVRRMKDEPPPPAAEAMIDIDLYACITVDLAEPGARRAEVLARHEVDAATWRRSDQHLRKAMEREARRGARTLRERFDEAYVLAWEVQHPDRFALAHYARVQLAQQRGLLAAELEEQGLDVALGMRLRRVWRRRLDADAGLRAELDRALASLRAPSSSAIA